MRDVADHLQRRVGKAAGKPRQSVGQPEDETNRAANGETGQSASGADTDIGDEFP